MTEEDKRQLALSFFQQEQQKLQNRSAFVFDQHNVTVEARVQRSADRQKALSVLARNGITWEDLKAAYDESYDAGQRDMVDFRMTFFYSSAAIALHEAFSVPADSILGFLERVAAIMGEEKSVEKIKQKALDITGVDVAYADTPPLPVKTSRSDKKVIYRMRKTGITQNDLEEEKQIGYQHGWNTQFFLSACYAATALALHEMYSSARFSPLSRHSRTHCVDLFIARVAIVFTSPLLTIPLLTVPSLNVILIYSWTFDCTPFGRISSQLGPKNADDRKQRSWI